MSKKDKLKDLLRRPRGWFLALFFALTAALIAFSIIFTVRGSDNEALGVLVYGLYGVTAVLFGYSVSILVVYAPKIREFILRRINRHEFLANVMDNYGLKTLVFSSFSLVLTLAFVAVNLFSAITSGLVWYYALSAYYFVLLVFRGGILFADFKCSKKFADDEAALGNAKRRIYRAGGCVLLALEIAMAFAVTKTVLSRRPAATGQIVAIANAAYTFYKMTMAIINLVRAKCFSDPVVQTLRNVNFADACMAIASLTVVMLSAFGGSDGGSFFVAMKACAGFAACAVTIALAVIMIVKGSRKVE